MTRQNQLKTEILHREIVSVMKRIRMFTPDSPVSIDQAKRSAVCEGFFKGRSIKRVIIYLRSSGCFWAVQSKDGKTRLRAGCLDCEHSVVGTTRGVPIPADAYLKQFIREYEKYDFSGFPMICVYNEGNFFNEKELPAKARRQILSIIAANPYIEGITLECLPEFITQKMLKEVSDILVDKYVEIGMGLESSDQQIRTLCVNKSFNLKKFEESIGTLNGHFHSLVYVLIKPSFLTESEALEDACRTVRYAFSAGAEVISLEPVSIGKYSMASMLNQCGLHRPPWLWTVIEVARLAHSLGKVRVSGDNFAPKYDHHAYNCIVCTEKVRAAIRKFNVTNDINVFQRLDCSCKEDWYKELSQEYRPLLERIPEALSQLRHYLSVRDTIARS